MIHYLCRGGLAHLDDFIVSFVSSINLNFKYVGSLDPGCKTINHF